MQNQISPEDRHPYQSVRRDSQPNRYRKCQSATGCQDTPIEGHLIPKSHLKRLQPKGDKVVVSTKYARALGPLRHEFPTSPVGHATVGYFTCIVHDQDLAAFDRFAELNQATHGNITQILDNLYLRGLMHQRWWMRSFAQSAPATGEIITCDKPEREWIAELASAVEIDNHNRNSSKLLDIQKGIEHSSTPNMISAGTPAHGSTLIHTAFKAATTQPHFAAYQLGFTLEDPLLPTTNILPIQTALIALEDGYVFAISSPPEYQSLAHRCILGQSNGNTPPTSGCITKAILTICETVAFSELYWNSLPDQTRQQIIAAHTNPTASTLITVDLLAGTRWEVLPTR